MPPVRNRRARKQENRECSSSTNNADSIESLRRQCAEKGLLTHGRKNALVARLQNHAAQNVNSPLIPSQVQVSSALLTEPQIAQIQSIITRTVEQSVSVTASNAARAAFQAMANSTPNASENTVVVHDESEEITVNPSSNTTSTNALTFGSNQAANSVAYGNGFHEVPAQYIKQIQSGEFFDLSKLLPKNMSTNNHSDEPTMLTLKNSVIKVKKAS